MADTSSHRLLVHHEAVIDLQHETCDRARPDWVRRFEVSPASSRPVRISAEVATQGVPGVGGDDCMIFFNLEYAAGPVFWDTFLYPETGSVPWRALTCQVRPRGELKAVEMHIRMSQRGRLQVRNVRVEEIADWPDDADLLVAVFGDSTDMTCYLPLPHRLTTRLEMLLRDRFADQRIDVRNLAEGGEFLRRLIDTGRLQRELAVLPRCDIAMLRYGLNDVRQNIEPGAFARQLHEACDIILQRFPDAQIVLSTTIPPKGATYDPQTIAVASERGLPVLRLDEHLLHRSASGDSDWHRGPGCYVGRQRDANPPDNPDGLGGDLHPNAHGARIIAEFYFEHLEPIAAARLGT